MGDLLIELGRQTDLQLRPEVTRSVMGRCSLHQTTGRELFREGKFAQRLSQLELRK
jgi:hypothetical protein